MLEELGVSQSVGEIVGEIVVVVGRVYAGGARGESECG